MPDLLTRAEARVVWKRAKTYPPGHGEYWSSAADTSDPGRLLERFSDYEWDKVAQDWKIVYSFTDAALVDT